MCLLRLCALSVVVLTLAVPASSAVRAEPGDKLKEAILGKWEMARKEGAADVRMVLDFGKDGKLSFERLAKVEGVGDRSHKGEGSYKVLSDDEIETTVKREDGKEVTDKVKVSVKGDEMTIKPVKGDAMTFKRVKA